jgi:hypothetical protein
MPVTQMVTLAQAKAHLRITTPAGDPMDVEIQLKLDAATMAIRRYVGRSEYGLTYVTAWTSPETSDPDAQAAVLLQLGELWRFRGDDPGSINYSPARDVGSDFSPVVVGLLRRFSHSVLA